MIYPLFITDTCQISEKYWNFQLRKEKLNQWSDIFLMDYFCSKHRYKPLYDYCYWNCCGFIQVFASHKLNFPCGFMCILIETGQWWVKYALDINFNLTLAKYIIRDNLYGVWWIAFSKLSHPNIQICQFSQFGQYRLFPKSVHLMSETLTNMQIKLEIAKDITFAHIFLKKLRLTHAFIKETIIPTMTQWPQQKYVILRLEGYFVSKPDSDSSM